MVFEFVFGFFLLERWKRKKKYLSSFNPNNVHYKCMHREEINRKLMVFWYKSILSIKPVTYLIVFSFLFRIGGKIKQSDS